MCFGVIDDQDRRSSRSLLHTVHPPTPFSSVKANLMFHGIS